MCIATVTLSVSITIAFGWYFYMKSVLYSLSICSVKSCTLTHIFPLRHPKSKIKPPMIPSVVHLMSKTHTLYIRTRTHNSLVLFLCFYCTNKMRFTFSFWFSSQKLIKKTSKAYNLLTQTINNCLESVDEKKIQYILLRYICCYCYFVANILLLLFCKKNTENKRAHKSNSIQNE